MPTYDYQCNSCGHSFEYFQNMSDEPLDTCPECGKSVKRLIGGGLGVIFKGSGFYVTDNKTGNPASTPTEKKSESKDTKKSDKAASTSTAKT